MAAEQAAWCPDSVTFIMVSSWTTTNAESHAVSKAGKVYLLNKTTIKLYKNVLPTKTLHNKTNVTQHDLNGKHAVGGPLGETATACVELE